MMLNDDDEDVPFEMAKHILSYFFHRLVGPPFKFFRYELYGNIPTGTP